MNVNADARLPLTEPAATRTSPTPAACAAVFAVSEVGLTMTTSVAGVPPTVTVAPDAKPVPVIVTVVPPNVDPVDGETAVTVIAVGFGPGGVPPSHAAAAIIATAAPSESTARR